MSYFYHNKSDQRYGRDIRTGRTIPVPPGSEKPFDDQLLKNKDFIKYLTTKQIMIKNKTKGNIKSKTSYKTVKRPVVYKIYTPWGYVFGPRTFGGLEWGVKIYPNNKGDLYPLTIPIRERDRICTESGYFKELQKTDISSDLLLELIPEYKSGLEFMKTTLIPERLKDAAIADQYLKNLGIKIPKKFKYSNSPYASFDLLPERMRSLDVFRGERFRNAINLKLKPMSYKTPEWYYFLNLKYGPVMHISTVVANSIPLFGENMSSILHFLGAGMNSRVKAALIRALSKLFDTGFPASTRMESIISLISDNFDKMSPQALEALLISLGSRKETANLVANDLTTLVRSFNVYKYFNYSMVDNFLGSLDMDQENLLRLVSWPEFHRNPFSSYVLDQLVLLAIYLGRQIDVTENEDYSKISTIYSFTGI